MKTREAICALREGRSPVEVARELLEFFEQPAVGFASLAAAQHFAPRPPGVPVHRRAELLPVQDMKPEEQELMNLVSAIFQMLQRAHLRANDVVAPLGIRYEVRGALPFPDLRRLTTYVPDLFVNVELRDVMHPRRLPQVVRYRVSVSRAKRRVSVRPMDPKLKLVPVREVFNPDPAILDFQVRSFESRLSAKLVERARRAFRR